MGRRSRSSSCSSRTSKSSDDCCYEGCDYSGAYLYLKQHLLLDKSLMASGSGAFINTYSQLAETIPLAYSVPLESTLTQYGIDHFYLSSPYYVREDGVYILFFMASDNQSSQYTVFVNGNIAPLTTIGTNSGAGQLVSRHMLVLKKDDAVLVRNYLSEGGSITQSEKIGGLNNSSDTVLVIMKIAPHPHTVEVRQCEEKEKICKDDKAFFKRVLGDMLYDKDLMLKGFNTHGSFFSKSEQFVALEAPVLFDLSLNVNNIGHIDGSGDIKIMEDGYYKVFFLAGTANACQVTYFVNGSPINATCTGTNKGAGQLTVRAIIPLNKNDILSVRNHTSANSMHISINPGGGDDASIGVNTILTLFKIAPLNPLIVMCEPKEPHGCHLNYKAFRQYLLGKKKLQIDGAQAYSSASATTRQELNLGDSIYFANNQLENYRVEHSQGTTTFKILRDGIYDVFGDVITNQPAEFTVFVNNVPDTNTTFGRDSGASRTLLRQFLKLRSGDVLTLRNYESALGKVITASNPGGMYVGQNVMFMLFRLSPIYC
jgi:hypothetical protein